LAMKRLSLLRSIKCTCLSLRAVAEQSRSMTRNPKPERL